MVDDSCKSRDKVVSDPGALRRRFGERQCKRVVFTNGCFDILHRGHVCYLAEAADLGDCLVVGINSDASVRTLGKGDGRPFNGLEDRMQVIAALGCVDFVIAFDEPTPLDVIDKLRPDVLVKGGDWPQDRIVGADLVKQRGGEAVSIPFRFERSTTALVERIRESGARK